MVQQWLPRHSGSQRATEGMVQTAQNPTVPLCRTTVTPWHSPSSAT